MRELSQFEIEAASHAAHEVLRSYSRNVLDDYTHAAWDDVPEESKREVRQNVISIMQYDYTAEKSHEIWMAQKLASGWRWGNVKNPEKREHPCLVEYKLLPEEQRFKDELWVSTVRLMLTSFLKRPQ